MNERKKWENNGTKKRVWGRILLGEKEKKREGRGKSEKERMTCIIEERDDDMYY
jgi:hypothetical protein